MKIQIFHAAHLDTLQEYVNNYLDARADSIQPENIAITGEFDPRTNEFRYIATITYNIKH